MFALPLLAAFGQVGQGVLGLFGGAEKARGYAAQALASRIEAETARLQGTQMQELSRERLRQTLGTINAVQSGRNLSIDSPTMDAVIRKTQADSYRDEATQVLAALTRASAADLAAKGYRRASRFAIPLAAASAVGNIANALSSAALGVSGSGASSFANMADAGAPTSAAGLY